MFNEAISESGYENAPATRMLATRCAVCSRSLLDSISVEIGMGPTCRERHGYNAEVGDLDEAARKAANVIVHRIAANFDDDGARSAGVAALRLMGFRVLADRILHRGKNAPTVELGTVTLRVSTRSTGWYVKAPYRVEALEGFRLIPGRQWDAAGREWFVPWASRRQLWDVLVTHYAGHSLVTDKGTTEIKATNVKVAA